MADLRPISLCNFIYKIMSKMLTNRLKFVLDGVISEHQSTFIPECSITDSIIVAHEVMHLLKRKRRGVVGFDALNIDISKAYDKLEWHYLLAVLEATGFSRQWVNWMKLCVCSV